MSIYEPIYVYLIKSEITEQPTTSLGLEECGSFD